MKPKLIQLLVAICAAMMLLGAAQRSSAQVDATAWTSVEGTTIWARLDGMAGDKVILHVRGRTYRVPVSRLAPKSIDKLGRMLNLPGKTAEQIVAAKRAASPSSVRSQSRPKPRPSIPTAPRPELRPLEDLVIAEPPAENEEALAGIAAGGSGEGPEGLDVDGTLPMLISAGNGDDAGFGSVLPPRRNTTTFDGREIRLDCGKAHAAASLPDVVRRAIAAGNRLQDKYYKWGGGRARLEDSGYDCSGSVSYVLIHAGLLRSVLHSSSFTKYGAPGPGRWITIYARNGHVFMTICGLRLDTGGSGGRGESGPRWRTHMRGTSGFVMRHPPGF